MKIKPPGHDPFAKRSLQDVQRAAADLLTDLNVFTYLVEAFILRTGIAQTRFGREAVDQADFVRLMRSGRHFKLDTLKTVLAHVAAWSPSEE